MTDTGSLSSSEPPSSSNKRRRVLADDDDNQLLFAQLPLLEVTSFLEYNELLAVAAVNRVARAAVESGMERVYNQQILQKHACDETFGDRVRSDPPNSSTNHLDTTNPQQLVSLPFRYLVRKARDTHLYEITENTDELSGYFSRKNLVLSPSEDRLAVILRRHSDNVDVLLYDLINKKRLGGPLLHEGMRGLYFLDDGRVISSCPNHIRIWTLQEQNGGRWIDRISYSPPFLMRGWVVYKQREILFGSNEGDSNIFEIKSLDLNEGSARDAFTVDLKEQPSPGTLRSEIELDILGDRLLVFDFYTEPRNHNANKGMFVYDLEGSQGSQSLSRILGPITQSPIKNSQSQPKFLFHTYTQTSSNAVGSSMHALQIGHDGQLTRLESFVIEYPVKDHRKGVAIGQVSNHQSFATIQAELLHRGHRRELFVDDFKAGQHVTST